MLSGGMDSTATLVKFLTATALGQERQAVTGNYREMS